MKKKDKAAFDDFVINARHIAAHIYIHAGYVDAEDMAQDVALRLSAQRIEVSRDEHWNEDSLAVTAAIIKDVGVVERGRIRRAKSSPLKHALSAQDPSTPYHFLIAQEIAAAALSLDLDSLMMGDTLEDEAAHYGVTRQRAHQIVNGLRAQMAEYLEA